MNGSVYDDQIANLARLEAQREKLNSDYEAFREQAELFRSELEKLSDKQRGSPRSARGGLRPVNPS